MNRIISIFIIICMVSTIIPFMSEEAEADTPTDFATMYTDLADDAVFQYWAGNNTYMVHAPRGLYATGADPTTYDANWVNHAEIYSEEQGVTLLFGNDDEHWNMYHNSVIWIDETQTSVITVKDSTPDITDKFYTRFGYTNYYLFDGIDFIGWASSGSANGGEINIKNATVNMTTSNGIYMSSVSPGRYNFENVQFGTEYTGTPAYGYRANYVYSIITNCTLDYDGTINNLQASSHAQIDWIGGTVISLDDIRAYGAGNINLWYRGIVNESGAYGGQITTSSTIDNTYFDTNIGDGFINIPYGRGYEEEEWLLSNDTDPVRYAIVPPVGKMLDEVTINDVEIAVTDNVFYYNNTVKDPYINITYTDFVPYPVTVNLSQPVAGTYPTNTSIQLSADGSEGDYYIWDWEEGTSNTTNPWTNITYTSAVEDTEIKLTVMHGYDYYSENATVTIDVLDLPVAVIDLPEEEDTYINNTVVDFNATGTVGANWYNWTFGDGNYTNITTVDLFENGYENITTTEDFDDGVLVNTTSANDNISVTLEEKAIFDFMDDDCTDTDGTDNTPPTVDPKWYTTADQNEYEHFWDHDDDVTVPEGTFRFYSDSMNSFATEYWLAGAGTVPTNHTIEFDVKVLENSNDYFTTSYGFLKLQFFSQETNNHFALMNHVSGDGFDIWSRSTAGAYVDTGIDITLPEDEWHTIRIVTTNYTGYYNADIYLDSVYIGTNTENWYSTTANKRVYWDISTAATGINAFLLSSIRIDYDILEYTEYGNWTSESSSVWKTESGANITDINITASGDAYHNYSVHIKDDSDNLISNSTSVYTGSEDLDETDFDNGFNGTEDDVSIYIQLYTNGTNSSVIIEDINITYQYVIGSSPSNTTHIYPISGNYTVNLTVGHSDLPGITDMDQVNITIAPLVIEGPPPDPPAAIINLDTLEEFTDLQVAINDTDTLDGHTLWINQDITTSGFYFDDLGDFYDGIVLNKSLTIEGNSSTDVSLTRGSSGFDEIPIYVMSENVAFINMTIDVEMQSDWLSTEFPFITLEGDNLTLRNITGDSEQFQIGQNNITIENCTDVFISATDLVGLNFINNTGSTLSAGTFNKQCNYLNITNNTNLVVGLANGAGTSNVIIENNTFTTTSVAISVNTNVISIANNTITDASYGVYGQCTDGTIKNNTFTDCSFYGVYMASGSDNKVYNNNFNNSGAYDDATNTWWNETAANGGGNYWSNWTTPDADDDGFVDNPYPYIEGSAGSEDSLPLADEATTMTAMMLMQAYTQQLLGVAIFLVLLILFIVLLKQLLKKIKKETRSAFK